MQTDNPAGRLLNILNEGKKIGVNTNNKDAWCQLLEIEEPNSPLLMYRLGKVMELPERIIGQINANFPNQKESHKHWSKKLDQAFGKQNLNGRWSEFISHIDQHTLDYLAMSVDLLDAKEATSVISSEKLEEIYNRISEIRKEAIDSAELDEGFKKVISKYLQEVLISIEEYKISGSAPIMENIEQTLGHTFFDKSYRDTIKNTEFGKKLLTSLSFVADIVTVSLGLPQISGGIPFLGADSE